DIRARSGAGSQAAWRGNKSPWRAYTVDVRRQRARRKRFTRIDPMNKPILLVGAGLLAALAACVTPSSRASGAGDSPSLAETSQMNVLLAPWTGPYGGVPPWDEVRVEDFPEAFETAIALRRAEIERIAADPDEPTFENTLVPLEDAGQELDRVRALFGRSEERRVGK